MDETGSITHKKVISPQEFEVQKCKGIDARYAGIYIYDPANGDPDSGIEAGTSFEDLPDDWSCPVCGAGKEAFEKVD